MEEELKALRAQLDQYHAREYLTAKKSVPMWVILLFGGLLVTFGAYIYYNQPKPIPTVPTAAPVVQTQVLPGTHTNTTEIRYIPQPAEDPAKVRIDNKPADFIVASNGAEVQVHGLQGETKPLENGQLGFTTQSTVKIDVTDMVRTQVNDALEEQSKAHKKELDRVKRARTRDKIISGVILGVGTYLAVK